MINQDRWIQTLHKSKIDSNEGNNQINNYKWSKTNPSKNNFSYIGKYSLMFFLFFCGLIFVSAIKNETRNLEKKIANLTASKAQVRFNLDQAILDNEVITSPENISRLAEEYLNDNFISYNKSQIGVLGDENEISDISMKKNNTISKRIKVKIAKKKTEIKKLQEIYSNPKKLPQEIKKEVAYRIEQKKSELKNLYNAPKEIITFERAQKWVVVQVAKLFLGIPVVPGR